MTTIDLGPHTLEADEEMRNRYITIIGAYKRIRDAANADEPRGVRLSAEECDLIWFGDDAISNAVQAYDEGELRTRSMKSER